VIRRVRGIEVVRCDRGLPRGARTDRPVNGGWVTGTEVVRRESLRWDRTGWRYMRCVGAVDGSAAVSQRRSAACGRKPALTWTVRLSRRVAGRAV